MPKSALIIGHGGFGTTMTALRAGVPQIVLPLFSSDHYVNAELVHDVGVGLQLPRGPRDVPTLPAAVEQILGEERFAAAAQDLEAAIAALPDVSTLVPVLEAMINR